MTVEYLDLADFLVIAEEITGIEVPVLMKMSRLSLADSALHAPQAGYGDVDPAGHCLDFRRVSTSGPRRTS